VSRWKGWAWLLALLAMGGLSSPPFWSGVRGTGLTIVAFIVLTAARELGRLALGCALGLRPAVLELGEAMPWVRFRTGRLLWIIHRAPLGSSTAWEPPAAGVALRARVAALALARPAVTGAVLLAAHAAGVPLGWSSGTGGQLGHALAMAAEILLIVGLLPFSIAGQSIVPFESDGLKLVNLLSGRGDPAAAFGQSYYAIAREALMDNAPARALDVCRQAESRLGAPWLDVMRSLEALARARSGDYAAAMAQREAALRGELQPVARAAALNDWSWYAFLERDDRKRRLADRRSAQAVVLKPDLASLLGTRGAVLLWQGRLAEAAPLLERATAGAQTRRARDINQSLVALASACAGDVARARRQLAAVSKPDDTEGVYGEAQRLVDLASQDRIRIAAHRGRRALVILPHGLELHDGRRVHMLAAGDIRRVEVGLTARGRAQLGIGSDRGNWRLPLAASELTWVRLALSRLGMADLRPEPTVAAAEGTESLETQERAYQERARSMAGAVSTPHGVLLLSSMVAFAASTLLWSSSWQWVGMLLPILFVHELGHWVAMRAFGHHDAKIAFIPLMGAATTTRIPFQKRWQEIVMLLAGPLPGAVAGLVLLSLPVTRHMPRVQLLAITALTINVLNLLPLHPLDGGRILHALVTAGRPRLDLAFKTVAELLFLSGGIGLHDPVLMGLGVLGILVWPHARRLSVLERRIRGTPGFDPRLPPRERRAYIFRALAHEAKVPGKDWAATVTSLEGPLAYQPLPGWKIALGGLVTLVVLFAGLAGAAHWMARVRGSRRMLPACPQRTAGRVLSCADPAQLASVDWDRGGAREPAVEPGDEPRFLHGFVWCSAGPDGRRPGLGLDLEMLSVAGEYCGAYPWELPGGRFTPEQERARRTLWDLHRLVALDREALWNVALERARRTPWFDATTAELLHRLAGSDPPSGTARALTARLGAAPKGRCGELALDNVRHPEGDLMFSVSLKQPADFAPLAAFLCQAGCTLSVLPADASDERLDVCR